MDFLLVFIVSFVLLLFSSMQGYFVAYALLAAMIMFVVVLVNRGYKLKGLVAMAAIGSRKSLPVLTVLLPIGALTAIWMAAGTIPAIVYYGMTLMHPQYFILAAFVLTSLVSLLIGSSFGAVSTIGLSLMVMANGSSVSPPMIAGAIIAGAYFGDRCSPVSSSANLIATVTQTNLYANIRNMWKTAWLPTVLSVLIYAVLSLFNPVTITNQALAAELSQLFQIHFINLLPAIVILVLSLLQVPVKRSILVSIGVAIGIAGFYQHYSLLELLKFMLLGFELDAATPLNAALLGGGVVSMLKVSIVVVISTAFVGIFAGTRTLEPVEVWLERVKSRSGCFLSTCVVGTAAAAFGCTQTIAILLTQQLVEQKYKENKKGNDKLALDLENTVVVIAPLVPWNIAGLVPATVLHTHAGFIPFAVYLYLIPLLNFISLRLSHPPDLNRCNSRLKKKTSSSSSRLPCWQNAAKPKG
jgi:NhaC family Na+:H+ antiporter